VQRVSPPGRAALDGVWSPDGKEVAFVVRDDTVGNIWRVGRDGANARAITTGPNRFSGPDWSPDGRRIVYSASSRGAGGVFMVGVDGGERTRITPPNAGDAHGARWSPDGKQLVFYSNVTGNSELYVIGVDGSGLRNVTNDASRDFGAQWSRDGQRLLFWSNRERRQNLFYELDLVSGQTRRVTVVDRWAPATTCLEKGRAQTHE